MFSLKKQRRYCKEEVYFSAIKLIDKSSTLQKVISRANYSIISRMKDKAWKGDLDIAG